MTRELAQRELRELAARAKAAYTRAKRISLSALSGEPSGWTPQANLQDEWPKLAVFCQQHKLQPELLIDAVCNSMVVNAKVPHPSAIRNPRYLPIATKAERAKRAALRRLWEVESSLLRSQLVSRFDDTDWTEEEVWTSTLLDETNGVTPLTRYCVAKERKLQKVSEYYYARAAEQYAPYADCYDKTWGAYLPAGFAKKARARYARLYIGEECHG